MLSFVKGKQSTLEETTKNEKGNHDEINRKTINFFCPTYLRDVAVWAQVARNESSFVGTYLLNFVFSLCLLQ